MGRGAAGFSLIEILVVVALIAVLAGMTAPSVMGAIEQYELISTSQQVVSTIRSTRVQAVARNSKTRVRFDFPAAGQYRSQVWDEATAAWVTLGDVQELADGVSFGDFADVEFTTSGRLNAVAAASITVTNGEAAQDRTIGVSTSGRVQLQ